MDAIVALNPDLTSQKTIEPPAQVNNHHVLISARARVRIVRSLDRFSPSFSFDQHATVDETLGERKEPTESSETQQRRVRTYVREIDRDRVLRCFANCSFPSVSSPHGWSFTSRAIDVQTPLFLIENLGTTRRAISQLLEFPVYVVLSMPTSHPRSFFR